MDETRIPGVPIGPARHVEVTGVDFYRTVEALPVLKRLYSRAHRRAFDLYHVCGRMTCRLADELRGTHGGLLPSYLSWSVLGVLGVLYFMMGGSR